MRAPTQVLGPRLVAQGEPDHRHQYDVETGDETRLGCRGVEQPHLLQRGGAEQHGTGDEAAGQQQTPITGLCGRLPGLEPPQ